MMASLSYRRDPVEIVAAYLFYLCATTCLWMPTTQAAAPATCLVFLSTNGLLNERRGTGG